MGKFAFFSEPCQGYTLLQTWLQKVNDFIMFNATIYVASDGKLSKELCNLNSKLQLGISTGFPQCDFPEEN